MENVSESQRLINEIVQSNEMLRVQIWILGGLLSFIFLVAVGMTRGAWNEMKIMVANLTDRVIELEKENYANKIKFRKYGIDS